MYLHTNFISRVLVQQGFDAVMRKMEFHLIYQVTSQKEQLTLKGHWQLYLKSYIWEKKHKQSSHCLNVLKKKKKSAKNFLQNKLIFTSPKTYMDMTFLDLKVRPCRWFYIYLERKINMTFKWFETEGYIKEIISKAFSFRYAQFPQPWK